MNVSHRASEGEIKSAYKNLSLVVHPDKNNHPRAKEAFCSKHLINSEIFFRSISGIEFLSALRKASAVLLDKEKREEYDNYLSSPHGIGKEKFDLSGKLLNYIFCYLHLFDKIKF